MTESAENGEGKLKELIARQEIHDALMRYCRGVDHRDLELALSAYHPDARDEHGFFNGLASDFAKLSTGGDDPNRILLSHLICNEYVEFDEHRADVAYSETACLGQTLVRRGDGYVLGMNSCRYLDRFEERDGQWRIADRKLVFDWSVEHAVSGQVPGPLTKGMLKGMYSKDDPSYNLGFRKYTLQHIGSFDDSERV